MGARWWRGTRGATGAGARRLARHAHRHTFVTRKAGGAAITGNTIAFAADVVRMPSARLRDPIVFAGSFAGIGGRGRGGDGVLNTILYHDLAIADRARFGAIAHHIRHCACAIIFNLNRAVDGEIRPRARCATGLAGQRGACRAIAGRGRCAASAASAFHLARWDALHANSVRALAIDCAAIAWVRAVTGGGCGRSAAGAAS